MRVRLLLAMAAILPAAPVEVRLLSHVTSYASPPGTPVRAMVVGASRPIPVRSILHGTVRRSSPVRLGIIRERALAQIEFDSVELPGGGRRRVEARIVSLQNTREELSRDGKIRGVLAASTPGGWVRGLWSRPKPGILGRAAIGLTGASGTICSRASLGPIGAAGFFLARTALFRLPEPEIHLWPGAEMIVEVEGPDPVEKRNTAQGTNPPLAEIPSGTSKANGQRAADIINVALRGSREDIENAFAASGWYPAEPLTRSSFARAYRSWVRMRGYPTAPVSPLLYQGRKPDMVFQKSFNTIAKRHHVRIWETVDPEGGTVWAGAATHDTGITFSKRRFTLTHKIDPRIDLERDKVIADLAFAGCLRESFLIGRPDLIPREEIQTGSGLASARVGPCASDPGPSLDAPPEPSREKWPLQLVRRVSLESRFYLLRSNVYYYAYRGARKAPGFFGLRRPQEPPSNERSH